MICKKLHQNKSANRAIVAGNTKNRKAVKYFLKTIGRIVKRFFIFCPQFGL
jgi:hypothetical protein